MKVKNTHYLVCIICFLVNLSFAQSPPLPPTPKKEKKSDKIYGDSSTNDSKKGKTKSKAKENEILEVHQDTYDEVKKTLIPEFIIPIDESTNVNSIYYFKNVEKMLFKLDTLVSAEQIISLTKYKIHSNKINPTYLDSLANKAYKLNEEKKYDEAITVIKEILNQSPNNISGHKEIAYAYKHLGNDNLSNLHFLMMVKIINSVFKYGDGSRDKPYILNNFYEGLSIYEAKFGCFPKKVRLILTSEKKLLGGYDCFHIMRFSNLTHWLPLLKKDDYKIEE
ncbi:DUF4919 domain-containing protein [Flavobacterium sp. ALJ2]|uniref:DUF4919 domain-containing protein n=1 Tax=Flavobacterium sp. ALJ2 TaxID=2786960 RepID=UPI00189D2241|nr:DUF4919 domain-containing protein [Flavobacterium sp. ALJ2]MBF7093200.1 DUF4919 domain-containing protein [Flavobacterium sp. ALJ2]